jgi:hypothetical protein
MVALVKALKETGPIRIHHFLKVDEKPWIPWDIQKEMWKSISPGALINLLKSRQTGGTIAAAAAVLHGLITEGGDYLIAFHQADALLTAEKHFKSWLGDGSLLQGLNAHVTQNGVKLTRDLKRGIKGGRIIFRTARGEGARGGTFKGAVLSEAAFYEDCGSYIEDVKPSLKLHKGWLIIESTARAPGGSHQRLCENIAYIQLRNYWHQCPANQLTPPADYVPDPELAPYGLEAAYWYELSAAQAADPARFIRENASSDEEAFVAAGGLYFTDLNHPIRIGGDLPPIPGHIYQMGLDVAAGGGGDLTALCVLDRLTGQQVAQWSSNTTTIEQAAVRVQLLARRYNDARVCVDATGLGQAMLMALKRVSEYHNVVPFVFTKSSKSALWARVRTVLPLLGPLDQDTISELKSLETSPSGNPAAMAGATDDRAMALALAIQAGGDHWRPPKPLELPQGAFHAIKEHSMYTDAPPRPMTRLGLPGIRR